MLIVRIHNDGTGNPRTASYDWDVCVTTSPKTLKVIARGRVEKHDRAKDWRALVRKVAAASTDTTSVGRPTGGTPGGVYSGEQEQGLR